MNRITGSTAIGRIGDIAQSFVPGRMFFYRYLAKTREELPYWDAFPLVLPFDIRGDRMYGINLHYLSPRLRYHLLEKLLEYATAENLTERSLIRMNWNLLSNAAKFREVEPCVKTYLYSHIKSRVTQIDPRDWKATLFLPLESFQKKSSQTVWRESAKKIGA